MFCGVENYKKIQRVNLLVILLNAAVSAVKITVGLMIRSAAVTADGIHSVTDSLNNVIGMVSVRFAYLPSDEKHPYGHKKFETMATLAISAFLIASGISLVKEAVSRMIEPVIPAVEPWSFAMMGFTIAINIIVAAYEKRCGKKLNSDFLQADSVHTFTDIFISLSVTGSLFAVKSGLVFADTMMTAAIAVLIMKAAFDILKRSMDVLCDAAAIDADKIKRIVCNFDRVSGCHEIRSRGRSDDIHVDLHVLTKGDMSLNEAHDLSHEIGRSIKAVFFGVTDVCVHAEPVEHIHEKKETP